MSGTDSPATHESRWGADRWRALWRVMTRSATPLPRAGGVGARSSPTDGVPAPPDWSRSTNFPGAVPAYVDHGPPRRPAPAGLSSEEREAFDRMLSSTRPILPCTWSGSRRRRLRHRGFTDRMAPGCSITTHAARSHRASFAGKRSAYADDILDNLTLLADHHGGSARVSWENKLSLWADACHIPGPEHLSG